MESLRQFWSQSKTFRLILIISLIYFTVRLAAQVLLTAERMLPGQTETQISPVDLQIYVDASTRLEQHLPLYTPNPDHNEVYQYPPFFALAFLPFAGLLYIAPTAYIILQFLIRLAGYALLIFWWERIFRRLKLKRATEIWAWTFPVWVIFSGFWSDLTYMNVYILTALFATFFIEAILNENPGWAAVWLAILIQMKPQWAFAAVIPLLLGRWRFFFKLLVLSVVINIAMIGLFMIITGASYGLHQYLEYFPYVLNMGKTIPWRAPGAGFLGYNHSITQIVVYFLGVSEKTLTLALVLKTLILVPLALICLRQLIHPINRAGRDVPQLALGLAFILYMGVFIWMDWVWEVSMGCAVFVFLLAMQNQARVSRILLWAAFMAYAVLDIWQFGSYLLFGDKIITPNGYFLSDYSIYFPVIMLVILVFYGFLVKLLWKPTTMIEPADQHYSQALP